MYDRKMNLSRRVLGVERAAGWWFLPEIMLGVRCAPLKIRLATLNMPNKKKDGQIIKIREILGLESTIKKNCYNYSDIFLREPKSAKVVPRRGMSLSRELLCSEWSKIWYPGKTHRFGSIGDIADHLKVLVHGHCVKKINKILFLVNLFGN